MDWQKCYETGFTPWDKGTGHPELATALLRVSTLVGAPTGRVLVPGCGLAHDFAPWRLPGITVIRGLDIAPAAVAAAQGNLLQETTRTEQVELGDFFEQPSLSQPYDWLFEHTCFCAIPPERRADYVKSASHALRPGGYLLAIFYLTPWDANEDQTQGPPFGVSRDELDRYFDANFEVVATWTPSSTYPGREGKEELRLLRLK